jgi:hypothetical protein
MEKAEKMKGTVCFGSGENSTHTSFQPENSKELKGFGDLVVEGGILMQC